MKQALKAKEERRRAAKWREADHERRYWAAIEQGEAAVARGDLLAAREAVAEMKVQRALRIEAMVEAI